MSLYMGSKKKNTCNILPDNVILLVFVGPETVSSWLDSTVSGPLLINPLLINYTAMSQE
ncbi:hypothetical protein PilKf_02230 [Pillotina sp. SPG140]|jgi:hypothetical protein